MSGHRSKLIGVIDEGTNTARFVVFETPSMKEICSHRVEITQISPQEGWVEQNPVEILEAVKHCATEACVQLETRGYAVKDIVAIGITNQRETTVVWDKLTGEPLHNAIVWNDIRTDTTVDQILARIPDQNTEHFKSIAGLPISPYFSALKLRWMKDNVIGVRRACRDRRCLAGTIDSWLVWNLTGGINGGLHVTDVTNASRTLLMNIESLNWDPVLTRTFSIHPDMLPEIRSSSEMIGHIQDGSCLSGIPITAIMGNQQASLVGQMCFRQGQAKNTYRSGCFVLCNIGEQLVLSNHGLVTTVAYKMGKNAPVVYALEGSVAVAGSVFGWLTRNFGLMEKESDAEKLASSVPSTGDVYFVPAFSGLYAPYWRKDSRGVICGLTGFITKNHIVRAAIESICYQTRDIIEAMAKDCGLPLNKLHVDGPLTENNLLMQLQADLSGIPVLRSLAVDTTALGVAMAAGQAEGINVWNLRPENRDGPGKVAQQHDTFLPTTTVEERNARYAKWHMAVERSLGWAYVKKSGVMTDERYRLLASIPGAIFMTGCFVLLTVSQMLAKR